MLYVFIGGFRTTADLNANPAGMPDPWTMQNWATVLAAPRFWGNVLASTILAVATTAGVVIAGIMAAFVIARYSFRGRGFLYTLFAAGLMFPLTVAALPLTLLLRTLGLHGTYLGVIIPGHRVRAADDDHHPGAVPAGDPRRARGGGRHRRRRPGSGSSGGSCCRCRSPALVTVGILAFVGSWNGYLLPLLVISTGSLPQEFWPLPLGVTQFSTQYSQDTGAVLAYTSLAMIPALVFFLAMEKQIVGGLTGAVKG